MPPIPEITIDAAAWEETGTGIDDEDPTCRLATPIIINGTRVYLEAIEVREHEDVQYVVDADYNTALDVLIPEACWPVATTTINEREYVLVATSGAR